MDTPNCWSVGVSETPTRPRHVLDTVKTRIGHDQSTGKMSNSNTNSIGDSSHTQSIDDNAPLWKVKHRLLKIKGGGIRSCNKVTQSNISKMKRLVYEAKLKIKTAQARRTISLPTSSKAGSSSARAFDLDFDMNEEVS
ncbi:hypothetical protein L3X38_033970 [Prunus dulcis]|uniref:Uncharacterized protein n=1 Tax=Prunus dulcis TaxID=3755 RepID=A0AAD4VIL3_PRUDU|nr:hypothetical protein L3X38_033970 [Prunus dulcis]